MKVERRSLSRLALPIKAFGDRFALVALIALSIALLILSRAEVGWLQVVGGRIVDTAVPVLEVLRTPLDASERLTRAIGEWISVYEDNTRLREQNRRLLEWQSLARQLANENQALREVVGMDAEAARPTVVAARIVADTGGPFVHTALVDAGSHHGVAEGMAAVNDRGLVGRVIDVGGRSARLLLLTDLNSRIPVMVEPSRDQAILAGDNSRQPGLMFLPLSPRLSIGDRVVSSGRGGVLPPGLEVGVVRTIAEDKVGVATAVDWDRLEYVRLLEYARVLPPEILAIEQREAFGPPLPPGFQPSASVPSDDAIEAMSGGPEP